MSDANASATHSSAWTWPQRLTALAVVCLISAIPCALGLGYVLSEEVAAVPMGDGSASVDAPVKLEGGKRVMIVSSWSSYKRTAGTVEVQLSWLRQGKQVGASASCAVADTDSDSYGGCQVREDCILDVPPGGVEALRIVPTTVRRSGTRRHDRIEGLVLHLRAW